MGKNLEVLRRGLVIVDFQNRPNILMHIIWNMPSSYFKYAGCFKTLQSNFIKMTVSVEI